MKRVLVEMPPIMKQVLNVHNHSDLNVNMLCDQLVEKGWTVEFDCRISRTIVYSDCPQYIVDDVVEEVSTLPCVNCGCNPLIKSEEVV